MNRFTKRSIFALLVLVMLLTCGADALALADAETGSASSDTAAYICSTVKKPQVGSVGGEWAVLGLVRSGYDMPDEYYEDYYAAVEAYVTACDGVLHARKYTEYSRLIIALTSIGKDPADVAGYNLLTALGDFDKTVWQGISGPIWALIALDSGNYPVPENSDAHTQAARELYVENILKRQLADGGFALGGATADPDTTAMALLALSKYQSREDVETATDKALNCLSAMQESSGGYSSWGVACAESTAQAIMALCALGVSMDDPRFVKNEITLMDNLLTFQLASGGFAHDSGSNTVSQMATEQALLALAAAARATAGQSGLFEMDDLLRITQLHGDVWNSGAKRCSLVFFYRKNAPVWSETP